MCLVRCWKSVVYHRLSKSSRKLIDLLQGLFNEDHLIPFKSCFTTAVLNQVSPPEAM